MSFKDDVILRSLKNLRVELMYEYDKNFIRKAFFDEIWQEVKHDPGIGSLMNRHGMLRRSWRSEVVGQTIVFSSSAIYAKIHNEGGRVNIKMHVTDKMRRWAWYMFKTTEDEKYKGLALTKRSEINISFIMPKRQMVGHHINVDRAVKKELDKNIKPYLDHTMDKIFKKR
jgi:hypothetical protein